MWQWLGRNGQKSFLDQVLTSVRLAGVSSSRGVVMGSPLGEVDSAKLLAAVRTQATRMESPEEFVFQARTTSWCSHAYAALKDVTPKAEALAKIGVTAERFRSAAVSPRGFLAAWLMSFPLTARAEHFASNATVLRLMKADPTTAEDFRVWHVKRARGGDTQAARLLRADTLPQALGVATIDVAEGAVVLGFSARACWDLGGLSHVIIGTVFHYRIVDFDSGAPRVFEVRASVGGGSITGGLPDNLMAYHLWREQTATIEQLFARPELYQSLDELAAAPGAEQRLKVLGALPARFAKHSPALALLHLGAMSYRFFQRYFIPTKQGELIGGRYVVKHTEELQAQAVTTSPRVAFAERPDHLAGT